MRTYLRILGYAWRYRGRMILSVLLALGISVFHFASIGAVKPVTEVVFQPEVLQGYLDKPVFASGIGREAVLWLERTVAEDRKLALKILLGLVLALLVVKNLLRICQRYIAQYLTFAATRDLANDLYRRVQRFPACEFDREGTGEAVSRMTNDAHMVATGVDEILTKVFREPLLGIAALCMAFLISWKLTIWTVLVLPLAVLTITQLGRRIKRRQSRNLQKRADILSYLSTTLAGNEVVKSCRREATEDDRFASLNQDLFRKELRLAWWRSLTSPLTETLVAVASMVMIYASAVMVLSGEMTTGDFFAFYTALFALYEPVRRLSKVYTKVQIASAAGERMFEMMDRQVEVLEAEGARAAPRFGARLRFEEVRFRYEGRPDRPVLRGVDLEIRAGERIGLVGPNGHGKSTIAGLIPRFYEVTGGRITLDGVDLRDLTLASLRAQVGIVHQDPILLPGSIHDNITYGKPGATGEEVRRAARTAHADDFIRELPDGYETLVTERGANLSGGQKQRICLARALVGDPPILILDEPTSSIDVEGERLIREALDEALPGRTALIISHNRSLMQIVDRLVFVLDGRIAAEGSHDRLLASCEPYREWVESPMTPAG